MSKFRFLGCFAVPALLIVSLSTVRYASGSPQQDDKTEAERAKWEGLMPKIESMLIGQEGMCPPDWKMHPGPLDSANFAGTSVALIDICPLGASTELIVAVRLEAGQPVLAHYRKDNHSADVVLVQGSSAMHGRTVKLVPKKRAIYDVSWENDGEDRVGTIRMQSCTAKAYVWNPKTETFDWNRKLTGQATRSYCRGSKERVH
jgi:hypothetical protein